MAIKEWGDVQKHRMAGPCATMDDGSLNWFGLSFDLPQVTWLGNTNKWSWMGKIIIDFLQIFNTSVSQMMLNVHARCDTNPILYGCIGWGRSISHLLVPSRHKADLGWANPADKMVKWRNQPGGVDSAYSLSASKPTKDSIRNFAIWWIL